MKIITTETENDFLSFSNLEGISLPEVTILLTTEK